MARPKRKGWTVVSMKDDWKQGLAFGVIAAFKNSEKTSEE